MIISFKIKIIKTVNVFYLYFNTIRHLRLKQILYRLLKVFPKRSHSSPKVTLINSLSKSFACPILKPDSYLSDGKFYFLGELGDLNVIGWSGSNMANLWRYNQHYFDWLLSDRAVRVPRDFTKLTERWIENCDHPKHIGWDPYPTSLRMVNWIKAIIRRQEMPSEVYSSLYRQAQHLNDHIEWHLMGNHLFANAKALIFAGIFFKGKEPRKWLVKGLIILKQQIQEQILADGGHFELSPMYHSIILEDCLDVYNVLCAYNLNCSEADDLKNKISSYTPLMLNWLRYMTFSNTELSHFNDSVAGVAASLSELNDYALRLGLVQSSDVYTICNAKLTHLACTGYVHYKSKMCQAILDVGHVGAEYQPGHAHADTLSFELAINSKRFVVNSGTSCYERSKLRQFQRSTRAHSTVVVDGRDSSQVWSSFRVAKRANPINLSIDYDRFKVGCAHDGYKSLPGSPSHRREWRFLNRSIEIYDSVDKHDLEAIAFFYIHPLWKMKPGLSGISFFANGITVEMNCFTTQYAIVPSHYYPSFNKYIDNYCVQIRLRNGYSNVTFSW